MLEKVPATSPVGIGNCCGDTLRSCLVQTEFCFAGGADEAEWGSENKVKREESREAENLSLGLPCPLSALCSGPHPAQRGRLYTRML